MNNIKFLRGNAGMSQKELSDRLGVSVQSVVESEKKHASLKVAYKCADIFGVSVFEVLGEDLFRVIPERDDEKEYVRGLLD